MDKKIETVLLDFDGTVVDTGRGIMNCVLFALQAYGIDEPDRERLRYFVGPPLVDSFMQLYSVDREMAEKLVNKYRERYSVDGMMESDPYDGVEVLLKRLTSQGRRVALASSKPAPYLERLLEHFGFSDYISLISAPPIGHINPPKSELILSAIKNLGASPQTTIMVGDRHFDIKGAKAAGVLSIGAAYGYGGEKELVECGADMIAHSPIQIAELIENYENL